MQRSLALDSQKLCLVAFIPDDQWPFPAHPCLSSESDSKYQIPSGLSAKHDNLCGYSVQIPNETMQLLVHTNVHTKCVQISTNHSIISRCRTKYPYTSICPIAKGKIDKMCIKRLRSCQKHRAVLIKN